MFDSIIGAATTVLGPIASVIGARETNAANAKESSLNRDFQADMSSTSHQREVEDLKAAGLNPILSANAGSSTPGGSQAVMQNPMEALASSAREAMSFALAAKKQGEEIKLLNAQTKKANMETHVLSKDVPKADFMNSLYDKLGRPVLNKLDDMTTSNSSNTPKTENIQRSKAMEDALQRVRTNSYKLYPPTNLNKQPDFNNYNMVKP